jgi:hypothetical protein
MMGEKKDKNTTILNGWKRIKGVLDTPPDMFIGEIMILFFIYIKDI